MVRKDILIIALLVVFVDQCTKLLVRSILGTSHQLTIIKNIFYISFIENTGAAFGTFQGQNVILTIISIVIIGYILWYYQKIPNNLVVRLSGGFILGGALGNLIDRILLGKVTDFLQLTFWPTFNIADSAILVGVIGALYYYYVIEHKERFKRTEKTSNNKQSYKRGTKNG